MNRYHGLQVRTGAVTAARIFVNGVPYGLIEPGAATMQSLAIHVDVLKGKNRVVAIVGSPDVSPDNSGQVMLQNPSNDLFAALVLEVEELGFDGTLTRDTLDEAEFRPAEKGQQQYALPHVLDLGFVVDDDVPSPAWAEAERLDARTIGSQLRELVRMQHERLEAGDFAGFTEELFPRYRDHQRAFPLGENAEQKRDDDRNGLTAYFSMEGTRLQPLPDALSVKAYADDRIFELLRSDGTAAIKVVDESGMTQELEQRFAMINGKLQIIR